MWVSNPTLAPVERPQQTPLAIQRVLPAIASGAVLNVVVAGALRSGAYELLVSGQRLTALSEHKLDIGGQYRLQVTGFDQSGHAILRPLPAPPSPLQAALQQRLTTQLEPSRLLHAIYTLMQSDTPLAQSREVAAFIGAFAQRRDVTNGDRLAGRMRDTGLFFESLLSQAKGISPSDLKGLLLKLSAFLSTKAQPGMGGTSTSIEEGDAPPSRQSLLAPSSRPAFTPLSANSLYQSVGAAPQRPFSFAGVHLVTEMLDLDSVTGLKRAVDGAISRIEAQQLLSLQAQHQQQTFLLFEIPVVDRDQLATWHMHIRDESRHDPNNAEEDDNKRWTVVLAVELPAIGPLSIRLNHGEEATEVTFYSERQAVCGAIDNILPQFTRRLEALGFNSVQLTCCCGKLPEAAEPDVPYPSLHAQA